MPLTQGQVLNNRYRIVKLLGQGGFGAVYRAWDTSLNAPCALKENYEASPEAVRQFAKEASLLANLRHPNLPKVMDHFSLPGQGQYLVMEYIEGQDLQEMLDQANGPLPEAQVLAWIGQVCDALSYLHHRTQPIIHRDLKPANIRITPEGQAVLVDFGIAKVYDPQKRTSTAARAVTPGYAPFEQYGQRPTDARTDIYALGATAYHLLTGQKPPDSVDRIPRDCLPAPRRVNPAISPETEAAILKAMQIDPEQRFQSAVEMKKAISSQLSAISNQPAAVSRPVGGSVQPTVSSGTMGQFGSGAVSQSGGGSSAPQIIAQPPIANLQSKIANLKSKISNLKWPLALVGLVVVILVLWALWPKGTSEREATQTAQAGMGNLAATQTALEEKIAHLTETARPTRTPRDTATLTWTPGPSDTPTPTDTPLPTDTSTPTLIPTGFPGMVLIPAGEFQMGSEEYKSDERPVHNVYLDAYYIDVYEVTNALFSEFVQASGYQTTAEKEGNGYANVDGSWRNVEGADWRHPKGPFSDLDGMIDHPVVLVSWYDALAYCEWRGGTLPSEAQWERAASGGLVGKKYPWGDENLDCGRANFGGNDGCVGDTNAVGTYSPNQYGLYDMAGNVFEWILDWYGSNYYGGQSSWSNPFGPSSGQNRVIRGGSWVDGPSDLRVAFRSRDDPSYRRTYVGFRCSHLP